MAHFARLDERNVVTQVIVVSNDDILDEYGNESEILGIQLCQKITGRYDNWKQTSYNNNMRVRYAGVGYTYNEEHNAFIKPRPYASWETLNPDTTEWESPLGPAPELTQEQIDNDYIYLWDEEAYIEDNTTGWVLSRTEPTQ